MHDKIQILTQTAIEGLGRYYREAPGGFHYTVRRDEAGHPRPGGLSLRYAAISHVGISRWLRHHPGDVERLPDLYARVRDHLEDLQDIGDIALWVWAACEGNSDVTDRFLHRMQEAWPRLAESCHAVELAWVLKACVRVHEAAPQLRTKALPILEDARQRLAGLFNEKSGLFRRHGRPGFRQRFSGQIACFADQVYPIVAMSDVAATFGDAKAKDMAGRTADRICDFQGPLGQWLWHYDVPGNRVCEPYPVFSVHQHGMAPMALLACDTVTGKDHRAAVEKGVCWIWGQNELGIDLVDQDEGIIWRDIERKEPAKFSRKAKAACCVLGIAPVGRLLGAPFRRFRVNWECRPYELGWILYAWADYVAVPPASCVGGVQKQVNPCGRVGIPIEGP